MKKFNTEEIIAIIGTILNWVPTVILGLFIGGYMENDQIMSIVISNSLVLVAGVYCIAMTVYQIANYFMNRKN